MKKILLSLAALAFAATINAQVWIGGEVGFTTNHTNGSDHTAMELNIAPDIGYSLSGNFSVAIALGYSHTSDVDGSKYGMPGMTLSNVNAFSINPYTCYTFVKAGNFAFYSLLLSSDCRSPRNSFSFRTRSFGKSMSLSTS